MRESRLRLTFLALQAQCTSRLKAVFELTPEERRVVLLVAGLFVIGLVVRLIRSLFLHR